MSDMGIHASVYWGSNQFSSFARDNPDSELRDDTKVVAPKRTLQLNLSLQSVHQFQPEFPLGYFYINLRGIGF